MKKAFLIILLFLSTLFSLNSRANAAPGDLLFTIGTEHNLDHLGYVSDVATDSSGNVYVVDSGNFKILKFSSSGDLLTSWGGYGSGNGQFIYPAGIELDSNGFVYVSDNYRIQKFDSSGRFITTWGSPGTGNGQFNSPSNVGTDSAGNVYVVDQYTYRIQKFDSTGMFITTWGSYGTGPGQFESPAGLAVDVGNCFVYVSDYNGRIQKFDTSGNYLSEWVLTDISNGRFTFPGALASDSSGNVYVVADGTSIAVFDTYGNFIRYRNVGHLSGLAVDGSGNVYGTAYPNIVNKFDNIGTYLNGWLISGSAPGQFDNPSWLAVDDQQNFYVVDTLNHRIQKFDSKGVLLSVIGRYGMGEGEFINPSSVAIDASGNLYVADDGNHRIQKLDSSGNFIMAFGSFGTGNGQFSSIFAVGVAVNGDIYAVENSIDMPGNERIQRFNSNGSFLGAWSYRNGIKDRWAVGFAVDRAGNTIYLSTNNDYSQDTIYKYDPFGNVLLTLSGTAGAIAVDGFGNLFRVSSDDNAQEAYIEVFDAAGTPKGILINLGFYNQPTAPYLPIAVNFAGTRVYLADFYKNIVQAFEGFPSTLQQTTAINCGGPAFTDATGQAYAADSFFSGGYTNSTTSAIPDTINDMLYQSWRYGNMSYNIPVANGSYNVTLRFSDWYSTVGKRVFDVKIEGSTVLGNFDIVAKAGYLHPYDVTIPVTVNDGLLNIQFINKIDNAKINSILIKPVANYKITSSAGAGGNISPPGSVSVPSGTGKAFTITPNTGYKISDVKVDGTSVGAVTTYTFSNVTANHTIEAGFTATATQSAIAVNCGGPAFTDATGLAFVADKFYSGGYINSTTSAIPYTINDTLYQSWRYGNMSYNIPLTSGNYNVILKFSDWYSTVGKRVFDVKMEGTTVLSNFDIVAKAGYLNPYDVTIPVTVTDGVLNIQFINKVDNAKINAIVVKAR